MNRYGRIVLSALPLGSVEKLGAARTSARFKTADSKEAVLSRGDQREAERQLLDPMLPEGRRNPGRPSENSRHVINGILSRLRTGAACRNVPERYGDGNRIYRRLRRRSKAGLRKALAANFAAAIGDDLSKELACHLIGDEAADCQSYDALIADKGCDRAAIRDDLATSFLRMHHWASIKFWPRQVHSP